MKLLPSTKIFSSESKIPKGGRGVFAAKKIRKDEVIEICPIILIPTNEVSDLRKTELQNYYFMWDDEPAHHRAAICLGYGELYNHTYTPNATYKKIKENNTIEFIALEDIELNEEITVNYNQGNPNDKSTLWIRSIPPAEK